MTQLLTLVATLWLTTTSAQVQKIVDGIASGIGKEAAAVIDPVEKTAIHIGFSQCKNVKKILGVDYDSYNQTGDEPDLNKLSLDFITMDYKAQYNLTSLISIPLLKSFNPKNGLIIYLHGYTDDPTQESYSNISDAFFKTGEKNILALDASSLISKMYLRSTTMVQFIGQRLGAAIATMMEAGMEASSIHLIGHSLGSHIASFTGKTVYSLTGQRVGRISGLDPAGPCFADVEAGLRLNKTDADYVDVIHTDAGVYGLNEAIGHVDYFPNSGSEQPDCLRQTCSHSRAWLYYTESVTNLTGFPAIKCPSWKDFKKNNCNTSDISYMGYASKPGTVGNYYLQTSGKSPYALGVEGLTHENNEGFVRGIRDKLGLWK